MSQYSEPFTPSSGESAAGPSVTDAARDEAADVSQHTRQAGGQVVQTATDQGRQVAWKRDARLPRSWARLDRKPPRA
jgi:hypothetical protein